MCAKIRQFFSLVAIIILVTSSARAEDEEAGDGDAPPKSCYKYTTDFMKSTTLTLLKCLGEKFKPKDFSEYITRSWCILKCVLKEMGTLTPDGKFDDIASAFYFEENFSSEVQQGLLPNVQGCFGFSVK
ncbi:uncharacterized protein LOC118433902 isoform X2 [Folsomia candida]|uniref:uncharacterized protein LOC118433902 isoform X2 n=1 Tax=Folsomia candida TaxID=158441 RepID=UPI001605517D|nr:uncharacterized protein LOC118433902 isoform X2 [Folsomia candida]